MKRIKKIASIIAVVGVVSIGWLGASQAGAGSLFGSEDANYIRQDQTVDGSAYLAGSTVQVDGTVNGDLYCAAQTVIITGIVEGDVLCAGQTITVSGAIKGDARLAGQTVSVQNKSTIAGGASIFGQSATVESGATIQRDTTLGVGSVLLNGSFGRDIIGGAQTLTLTGTVNRDVKGDFEDLKVTREANIGGLLHYTSNQAAVIDGTVKGETKHFERNAEMQNGREVGGDSIVALGFGVILWTMVIALALALLLPKKMETITHLSPAQALLSVVFGFSVLFGLPMMSVILIMSIVGAPLGIIGLVAWLLLMLISSGVTSYYIGRVLIGPKIGGNRIVAASAGAALLGLSFIIPVFNILTILASLLFGMGALVYGWRYEYDKKVPTKKARS